MTAGLAFPLQQCQQCAVKDEQKQISVSNQHIRVARWRVFNFAQVPFRCVLGMGSNSELNSKKMCLQNVLIFKKICSPSGFKPATSWMQVSQLHYRLSHMAVVFNGMLLEFSPLLHLQVVLECKLITALTHGEKLKGGGWWFFDVRQLMWWCQQSQAS